MNVLHLFTRSISSIGCSTGASERTATGADNAEKRLVAAAQQGDRRAFDALSEIYAPMLRGFLLQRVGASYVDDVLQETLLAGWIGLPGYNRRARFKSWLFAIAIRKVVDFYRARGRAGTLEMVPLSEADNHTGLQKDWYAATDWKQSIQVALHQLSIDQREVIELYYYAEMTLPEIAKTLERNLNTIKYQFYRAHALVGHALELDTSPVARTSRSVQEKPHAPSNAIAPVVENDNTPHAGTSTAGHQNGSEQRNRKVSEIR